MCSNVALDSVDDIDFQPNEIPTTNNIGMISAINTNEMIAIKAELLQKSGKKKVKTDDGEKFLGDPHGTVNVTLREPFSDLEEGKTYQFDNLLVRREYNTKEIILATPKTGCKTVETASFKENVIQPSELPKSFTTTTTPAEILGVQSFTAYHTCCQCKKIEQCYVQLYIDVNAAKVTVTVTVFHDTKNLLSQGKQGLPINVDNITSFFLELPTLSSITYNNKTKIVEATSI